MNKKWCAANLRLKMCETSEQVAKQKAKQCFLFVCAFSIGIVLKVKARQESIGKERSHRPGSIRNQPFFYFYNIAEQMKAYSQDLRWRVIYHQYLAGSSVQETADALYVSVRITHQRIYVSVKITHQRDVQETRSCLGE